MKVGVACVMQESNSFARSYSSLADFSIARGHHILEIGRGTNTEVGGAIRGIESLGHEVVPLFYAWGGAAGAVDDNTFEVLSRSLIEAIGNHPCDALLVALHGAWLSPSFPSCDAEIMRRVREKVGSDMRVVATLDYHANVRPALLKNVDALVGYRTYPHVDMAETGIRAARLLHRISTQGLRPVGYWLPVPLIAPPQSATTDHPLIAGILAELQDLCGSDAVLSTSFFCVQPWLDVSEVACSFVVIADGESAEISSEMRRLAKSLWSRREELSVNWVSPEDLISLVKRERRRPVIVSEAYDGTSAGGVGDHPGLLRLLAPHCHDLSAAIFLVDPEVAQQAWAAGLGKTVAVEIGAKSDDRFGGSVAVTATVDRLSDGRWTLKGPVSTGRQAELGQTAVLRAGGLQIVVASKPEVMFDPELYRAQGIVLEQQDIIGVKSPAMYRAAYQELGGAAVDLDMPGVCRGNFIKCPFRDIGWPIYPLNDFDWNPRSEDVFINNPAMNATRIQ